MAEKETVAVQQADAKQSSEEATKKRGWNIDYSQYKIPEGTTVEKARVFTFSTKEGEENKGKTHGLTAIINGEAKTVPMYANDVEAYFEKNSKGELTHRATLDQLVGKYFFNPNQKAREDYSKYDMPEGTTVEKANVYQSKVDGEWRVRADIDGKTQRAPLSKEDVNAYFDKDKDGNRRATPEQLVGKYFNWKSEHYFEKYRMPHGVEMTNANVFKAADTGKWMVEARIDGNKVEPVELTNTELNALRHKKSNGEPIATATQIAAKHFAPAVYQELKTAREQAMTAAKVSIIERTTDPRAKSFNIDQSDAVDKALGKTPEQRVANADRLMESVKPDLETRGTSPAWVNATANEVKAIAEDYEKYKAEQSQSLGVHR